MVIRTSTRQTSVSGVICMIQQLVVTARGPIVLQWRATIKTTAPNRIRVTLAGNTASLPKKQRVYLC